MEKVITNIQYALHVAEENGLEVLIFNTKVDGNYARLFFFYDESEYMDFREGKIKDYGCATVLDAGKNFKGRCKKMAKALAVQQRARRG